MVTVARFLFPHHCRQTSPSSPVYSSVAQRPLATTVLLFLFLIFYGFLHISVLMAQRRETFPFRHGGRGRYEFFPCSVFLTLFWGFVCVCVFSSVLRLSPTFFSCGGGVFLSHFPDMSFLCDLYIFVGRLNKNDILRCCY